MNLKFLCPVVLLHCTPARRVCGGARIIHISIFRPSMLRPHYWTALPSPRRTTCGWCCDVSSASTRQYAQMMIISPRTALRAAAPSRPNRRPRRRLDCVCGEAFTIIDVVNIDLFERHDASTAQEVSVDRDRSFVVQITLGHRCAVQFRFEHRQVHGTCYRCD